MTRHSFAPASVRLVAPLIAIAASAFLTSCDAFKPTDVVNPNITDQQFIGTPGAGASWVRGTQRQFLLTFNQVVQNAELASDNYFNNYTTNNQLFDEPTITYIDPQVTSIQSAIARLRDVAAFGLDTVFPRDSVVTAQDRADMLFYRGASYLFAGESFVALPATANGAVVAWQDLLNLAIADFTQSRTLATDNNSRLRSTMVLARAYHRLGNKTKAVEEASALLAASPSFLSNLVFDGINGPGNGMQGVLTSSVNNFQPLPRLDFLDPKYPNRGANIQSPAAFAKAEEAHLILAEAQLSDNNVAGAKTRLTQLLTLVQSRATESVDSRLQLRGRNGNKVIYPNSSTTRVAFAPGEPLRDGYVLTRSAGNITVPIVSGTSVTQSRIDAISTVDDGLYVLYLMRQEIFLAEGRRMADLGMRMPVAFTEVLANPNAVDGAAYTQAIIPSFIPRSFGMDNFVYTDGATTAIMAYDMNRLLVQNKASTSVLPFN